jgi:hypothetical protein
VTAEELIREVEAVGGRLVLRGNRIAYELPKDATSILTELKAHRDEVVEVLRSQCPPLPKGIRLVRYEPKSTPVAIDVCSVVTDVSLFIQREIEELNARLHSPVQIRGGWGVFTILDRLRQAGVELALEATVNPDRPPDAVAAQNCRSAQKDLTGVPKTSETNFGAPSSNGDVG